MDKAIAKADAVEVGDSLPEHVQGPITRSTLALFAGASNDYVPLHIDSDYARSAGMDDVFAHGMLSMAYLAQAMTRWAPSERLRRWSARFTAITPLYRDGALPWRGGRNLPGGGERWLA